MTTAAVAGPGTGLPAALPEDLAAASLALARRLHAGGTIWCAAPSWPHHAQHVAVEFVHPVVVGTPAVPAVALGPSELVATARANAVAGDVLVVIGRASEPLARELVRRAPAWGVTTLWFGTGAPPEAGSADHLLWVADDVAAHDGRLVLLYHLLWELSHVCLEHPALLEPALTDDGPSCTTCSDEGRLGEVVVTGGTSAQVRTARGLEEVDLSLVGGAAPEDLLVIHAGLAITVLPGAP